ncbi:MAG: hypothetical protein UW11_C0007G0013 [Parcubacteria group bacterium GW2011_GWA2_43_9b]|nr:MAG: hypothetical protein UW11_C0007G0013 [Parcubacteria group bacterium GW2011_GWA2_43_9b]
MRELSECMTTTMLSHIRGRFFTPLLRGSERQKRFMLSFRAQRSEARNLARLSAIALASAGMCVRDGINCENHGNRL